MDYPFKVAVTFIAIITILVYSVYSLIICWKRERRIDITWLFIICACLMLLYYIFSLNILIMILKVIGVAALVVFGMLILTALCVGHIIREWDRFSDE